MHVTLLLPGRPVAVRCRPRPRRAARASDAAHPARPRPPGRRRGVPRAGRTSAGSRTLSSAQAPLAGTAPYALAALSGTPPPPDAFLWHADPVHLELSRDHLVVLPLPAPPSERGSGRPDRRAPTQSSATPGATFERAGGRWFLRARRRWDLQAAPLPAVLGEPLYDAMPAGADAPTWNRLLNEIQMTWHAHPVNEAREARGDATVNSVWLHGGGAWKPLQRPAFAADSGRRARAGAARPQQPASLRPPADAARTTARWWCGPTPLAARAAQDRAQLDRRAACPRRTARAR